MKHYFLLLSLCVLSLLVGACATLDNWLSAPPAPTIDQALYDAGLTAYRARYCGYCHVLEVAGTQGIFGPPHDHIATTALERIHDVNYAGQATTAEAYLLESITQPDVYLVPTYGNSAHPMPNFSFLSAEELNAIVYFLLQQS